MTCMLCGEPSDQPGPWCTGCVGEQGRPSVRSPLAELELAPARVGPMRLLAVPISVLLLVVTGLAGMRASGLVVELRQVLAGPAATARMRSVASIQQGLTLAGIGLVLLVGALWLVWWAVAYANLRALGVRPRSGPVWAVVAWVVPFASLIVPQRIADELWKGSDPWTPLGWRAPRHARRAGVVKLWWTASCAAVMFLIVAAWGAFGLVGTARFAALPLRRDVAAGVDVALLISTVLTAAAGVAAITLVTGVTARQGDKARLMVEAGLLPGT